MSNVEKSISKKQIKKKTEKLFAIRRNVVLAPIIKIQKYPYLTEKMTGEREWKTAY